MYSTTKNSKQESLGNGMSSTSKQELPPPSYDQLPTTIDIDNDGTAPLLGETFSGSIFGTSTILTYGLASGSYPSMLRKS